MAPISPATFGKSLIYLLGVFVVSQRAVEDGPQEPVSDDPLVGAVTVDWLSRAAGEDRLSGAAGVEDRLSGAAGV